MTRGNRRVSRTFLADSAGNRRVSRAFLADSAGKRQIRLAFLADSTGQRKVYLAFLAVSGVLCILYLLLFRPVTWETQGDYPDYLDLARQIFHLPGASSEDLGHRSPLYSVLMGLFILLFGEGHYLVPLVVFQYFLVFLSSILVYKIILLLSGRDYVAFAAGLAGILNLATVFFGYTILSETLALFLFTLSAWLLLRYVHSGGNKVITAAGLATGLLILSRFNMMGLPVVIIILLILFFIIRQPRHGFKNSVTGLSLFVAGMAFVLSLWVLRNYLETGRYELIPRHHMGARWAVQATISPSDSVSQEYRPVHDIFIRTREVLLEAEQARVYRKSSLMEYGFIRRMNNNLRPQVSGYLMYRDSEQDLLSYYRLDDTPEGILVLNEKLKPFYSQIAGQHRQELRRFRFYSLLYTFKHISPTLPGGERLNLNRLPSPLLQAYKLLFIVSLVFVYAGSVVHMIWMLLRRERLVSGLKWFVLYGLIWYFPVVNWYASVLGDANRFRYPADMILLGLLVTFLSFPVRGRRKLPPAEAETTQ